MSRILYELVAADPEIRFSPYCWRARMALVHKGLEAEIKPWRFVEQEALAFSGHNRVPILIDGDRTVVDSWMIALYLEDEYPDRDSLFNGEGGVAPTRFVSTWADSVMLPGISSLIVTDVWACLDDECREYFRDSREKRYGKTLEDVCAARDESVVQFRKSLQPVRAVLADQEFLGGERPTHADYIVFGGFMWARCASTFELLAEDDPIWAWRERMLDLHGGYARNAKRVEG
ncbi:MAG TPA: glutathione S-transferase family protein [Saliniramus sp.]|nr:glutathione S-transferase family protein [Saliniramus sp.]